VTIHTACITQHLKPALRIRSLGAEHWEQEKHSSPEVLTHSFLLDKLFA
jgi:hypothetical protein